MLCEMDTTKCQYAVDTDVVVLAVTSGQRLNLAELWIAFGVGKNFRFFAAHEIAAVLGPEKCIALPMFCAFTRCDTVSFFGGKGKKTAWDGHMDEVQSCSQCFM